MESIVLNAEGTIVARKRVPTPSSYSACLEGLVDAVKTLEAEAEATCTVGIGMPGALSPDTGKVINSDNTPLSNHLFDKDLGERLGREVRVANDANCFALSEAVDGAGQGAPVVVGVFLGTGAGAGASAGTCAGTGTGTATSSLDAMYPDVHFKAWPPHITPN